MNKKHVTYKSIIVLVFMHRLNYRIELSVNAASMMTVRKWAFKNCGNL